MNSRRGALRRAGRFAERVFGELDELEGTGHVLRGFFAGPWRFGIVVAEKTAVLCLNEMAV